MSEWGTTEFRAFFESVWGHAPFAWQAELARQVLEAGGDQAGCWPEAIALPTASGKTACMDVAVFALAAQAGRLERGQPLSAPRRICFVVDRRVIVDEAFGRAQALAAALAQASSGIVAEVAARLRALSGCALPLAVQSLRGGQPRADDWAATPLQPTIITSTVDQVGSRLLFRAYGPWPGMWPVHAGLIGNDALILLDEAHCAQPMLQTLRSVRRYRSWADQPLPAPFEVTVLSATPPGEAVKVFHDESDQRRNPAHPLGRRQLASKPARLVLADKAKGSNAARRRAELAARLAAEALQLAGHPIAGLGSRPAVVVFCNRVDTARQVADLLRKDAAHVHLLTGRMRPIDKDDVIASALEPLASRHADQRRLEAPTFVVATQTLEVGADLDLDLLVSECASLDALRQRFGRLNRGGRAITAQAVVVAAAHDAEAGSNDPVYGAALATTWAWLQQQAQQRPERTLDFGIAALEQVLPSGEVLAAMNAPAPQSPTLLPAHLDVLVQTAPVPEPTPDIALFLHGPRSGPADVQVCWRSDLDPSSPASAWIEVLLRCPPSAPECLPVPFAQARRWLDNLPAAAGADLEGHPEDDADDARTTRSAQPAPARHALRWRGRDASERIEGGGALRPGDVLVLPAQAGGFDELGTLGAEPVADWGDRAHAAMRRSAVLRLHASVLAQWPEGPERQELDELVSSGAAAWEEDPVAFAKALKAALRTWAQALESDEKWRWLHALVIQAADSARLERALVPHPCGGWIIELRHTPVMTSQHGIQAAAAFFGDEDDAASSGHFRSLLIEPQNDGHSHLGGVAALAQHYAQRCGLPAPLVDAVRRAGAGHDLGKSDPRFQAWLRNGTPWVSGPLLAKSAELPQGRQENQAARERAGYPEGGRHELLSVRLLESWPEALPQDPDLRELVLHLVESHHGHCRPLAPVVLDPQPIEVTLAVDGQILRASSDTRLERLDAGPADRFWRLTRRYGWWGLAWLEALLRLADHRRSEWEQQQSRKATE